MSIVTAILNIS